MSQSYNEMIEGTVQAVVFQNADNGYAVLRLLTDAGEIITVVGTVPMTVVGERLIVMGKWGFHTNYGKQFEAEFLQRLMPQRASEIFAYLSSGAIKGIGEKTAAKLVERFGADTLQILDESPEQLAEIPGITRQKARQISQNFQKQSGMRKLIEYLTMHHLPAELAMKLYRVYGELAMDVLRDDPYVLTDSYFSADFSLVDQFALDLDFDADDDRRVEAGILFELSFNLSNGHTFLPSDKLIAATASLLGLEQPIVQEGVKRLAEQRRIEQDTVAGLSACYLPEFYEAERYVTEKILSMAQMKDPVPSRAEGLILTIEENQSICYHEKQKQAILAACAQHVLIVTGGPGTGKTTVMRGILDLFRVLGLKTQLAAPTGRAAKRLSEVTGADASTIHRLLEAQFDPETGEMSFCHDEAQPLKIDAMIVDETSMVDLQLMASVLRALPQHCKLILVGDPDQLPSVGAGNVFSDFIRSGVLHTVRLDTIFRQAQESLIVMNAHAVNHGELPELKSVERDFFFMKRTSAQSIVKTIQELCATRLPQNMGIEPGEIQVLTPSRKTETGTQSLNLALQQVLNPEKAGKHEKKYGDFCFHEGDRVMQIRNNYDILWKKTDGSESGSGIFNGDIGTIEQISFHDESVLVLFDDRLAHYAFDQLSELEPAYAITVHKSQGSEYRAVILCAWHQSPYLLTRSILYTAITRARELLIIVGSEDVLAQMTANDKQQRRYSGLKLRLEAGAR